jgi:hypothetical protein
VPREEGEGDGEEKEVEATVLGLGVEGGFKMESEKYDVVKEYALAVSALNPIALHWARLDWTGRVTARPSQQRGS